MPQFEQDREDILREAAALVERVELWVPGQPDPVVVGFRRDGSPSFFFGADPVLQFNASDELRRGYDQGRMLKAVQGRLVALRRVRDKQQVSLLSRELSHEEMAGFRQRVLRLLALVRDALQHGTARIGRQVPDGVDVVGRVRRWLETMGDQFVIANRPNVGEGHKGQ